MWCIWAVQAFSSIWMSTVVKWNFWVELLILTEARSSICSTMLLCKGKEVRLCSSKNCISNYVGCVSFCWQSENGCFMLLLYCLHVLYTVIHTCTLVLGSIYPATLRYVWQEMSSDHMSTCMKASGLAFILAIAFVVVNLLAVICVRCCVVMLACSVLCWTQVTGVIQDSAGQVQYVLSGTWDDKLEGAPVLNTIESSKGKVMYETGETKVLWQRRYPP